MLALVTSLTLAATPCASLSEAVERTRQTRDPGAFSLAAALLPGPLAERVRAEPGRTDLDGAIALLARAAALSCPPASSPSPPPEVSRLEALAAADGRFIGVRADDVTARVLDRLWNMLESLLESEGMQRFSEHTRLIYVSLLCFVCAFVALRVWRRSRVVARSVASDVVVGIERHRVAAFSALRDEATALIDRAPREALLLLRQALLARVGEHDEGAVRPSRTSSEILARLDGRVADVVAPTLHRFDEAFYGGRHDAEGARALLQGVDASVAALASLGRGAR